MPKCWDCPKRAIFSQRRCWDCRDRHRNMNKAARLRDKLEALNPTCKPGDVPRCKCFLALPCGSCLPTARDFAEARRDGFTWGGEGPMS